MQPDCCCYHVPACLPLLKKYLASSYTRRSKDFYWSIILQNTHIYYKTTAKQWIFNLFCYISTILTTAWEDCFWHHSTFHMTSLSVVLVLFQIILVKSHHPIFVRKFFLTSTDSDSNILANQIQDIIAVFGELLYITYHCLVCFWCHLATTIWPKLCPKITNCVMSWQNKENIFS